MVGKDDELADIDDESLARVKLIAEKKKQIEQTADQVRNEIKNCFEHLTEVLKGREKQLLRQVEAIHRQQISLVQSNSEILPVSSEISANLSNEQELVDRLLSFGKIELSNNIAVNDSEPYKAEEYQEACEDYVSFDKSLKSKGEEFDISSVIRRKRNSSGIANKPLSINFNCTSCDSCKFETNAGSVSARTSTILDCIPITATTPETSNNFENPSFKDDEDETFTSTEQKSPGVSNKLETNDNFHFEQENNGNLNFPNNDNASKPVKDSHTIVSNKGKDNGAEHPIQIQQWLKQILAETETEPIIHEIGQFSEIPNTRLYREFPVET